MRDVIAAIPGRGQELAPEDAAMETPTVFEDLRARLGRLLPLVMGLSLLGACAVSDLDVGPDEGLGFGGETQSGGNGPAKPGAAGKGGSGGGVSGSTGAGSSSGASGGAGGVLGGSGATGGTSGGSAGGTGGGAGSGGTSTEAGSPNDAAVDGAPNSDPKGLIQVVCGPCPYGFQQMNGLIDAPKNDVCQKGAACGSSYQNMCVKAGHQALFGCAPPLGSPWQHVVDVPNCDGYCPNGFYEVWAMP